jgi:superfamily II DNA/RNA helicase
VSKTATVVRVANLTKIFRVCVFCAHRDASEYLRRVGRTGRTGKRGLVTAIAYGRYVPIAHKVVSASKAGLSIDPVTADDP